MIHPKVRAGSTAAAASVLLVFVLGEVGVSVPAEVASAITTLVAFAGGYLKPSAL